MKFNENSHHYSRNTPRWSSRVPIFRSTLLPLPVWVLFVISTTAYGNSAIPKNEQNIFYHKLVNRISGESSLESNAQFEIPPEIRLYSHGKNLLLAFGNGHKALFKPSPLSNLENGQVLSKHHHESLGSISTMPTGRIWQPNTTEQIEFNGSFPVAYKSVDNLDVSFFYGDGDRGENEDENGNGNGNGNGSGSGSGSGSGYGKIAHKKRSNANSLKRLNDLLTKAQNQVCPKDSGPTSDSLVGDCEAATHPLPVGFKGTTSQSVIRIDVRPSDCHSFFTRYPDIQRGSAIEQAISTHPPYVGSESGGQFFPVADYWNNGNVYVLISRDLSARSYDPIDRPDALFQRIMKDGETIHNNLISPLRENSSITHTDIYGRSTTLYSDQAQVVYLDLVIQYGVKSPDQTLAIERAAADLLDKYAITLRVIEIP